MGEIIVEGLGKAYRQYSSRWSRLVEWLLPQKSPSYSLKWVIQDISFTVQQGEAIGIVGGNGAGKSTLLKIITGTTRPTTGRVLVNGRVAALLELGIGFHPDFTGRQNIFMAAQLLGYTFSETERLMPSIQSFAGIDEYLDSPLRIYSSGMQARLAFSVATAVRPDILIVDEALSVGDAYFQFKSFERIKEFQSKGTTILFVSHDLAAIRGLCNKCIWIDAGEIRFFGNTKEALDEYSRSIYGRSQDVQQKKTSSSEQCSSSSPRSFSRDFRQDFINNSNFRNDLRVFKAPEKVSWGDGLAKINRIYFQNKDGEEVSWIIGGEEVVLKIEVQALEDLNEVFVGFMVRDRIGQNLFGDNSYLSNIDTPLKLSKHSSLVVTFEFLMPIMPKGRYSITGAVASGTQDTHDIHEWCNESVYFESHNINSPSGLIGVPMRSISIET